MRKPPLRGACLVAALAGVLLALPAASRAAVPVVAAENMFGDVARQVGGGDASVTSILSSPDGDPHLFEATSSAARAVSHARVVVLDGAGYDPWMDKLLVAARSPDRIVVSAAKLAGAGPGANPHLWYDTTVMLSVADALAKALGEADPAHAQGFRDRAASFRDSLRPIEQRVAALRARFAGQPVTATEPVFGLMFQALGLVVRDEGFARAVMNDTEPGAAEIAGMEDDLRQHRVRLLLFNNQTAVPAARRMLALARQSGIPVVGASETEPKGLDYQHWLLDTLGRVEAALSASPGSGAVSAKAAPAAPVAAAAR